MPRTINTYLRYTAIVAIYLTLFVPLIVSESLFFPYITGKAHAFRLLVEIAAIAYLLLAVRDRAYLPKKSVLLWSMLAFTVVLGLATVFAESPYKSFWSNYERMEGYVTTLHLLALFVVASSVIRGRRMWINLFHTSLIASVCIGIGGFMDYWNKGIRGVDNTDTLRIAGTLGNSSYLGVYALLHMYIAGFLTAGFLQIKKISHYPFQFSLYVIAILFNAVVLFNTGTRGSFVGLVAGMFVLALILSFDKQHKIYRKVGLGVLIVVLVVVGFLGTFKNSNFVKNSDLLARFSSLITLDVKNILQTQGQARTLLWGMAWEGVKEKPILGWGQDNFGYVFAKYYDPKMYGQEQWFDRTHNVLFDWLIAGGVLGLLGYLSLFVAALLMLWRKPKNNSDKEEQGAWSFAEKATMTALFVAYFMHNLFVFDNLTSYIVFFVIIAYINERAVSVSRGESSSIGAPAYIGPSIKNVMTEWVVSTLIVVAGIVCIYTVVWKPYIAGATLIKALGPSATLNEQTGTYGTTGLTPEARLDLFKEALSYKTLGDSEIRERLVDVGSVMISSTKNQDTVKAYVDFIASEFDTQINKTPNDPRPYIFYSIYLQKFGLYQASLDYTNKAIALSPTKQSFLFQKGSIEIALKKIDEGVATFKQAYELETSNNEARALYTLALVYAKDYKGAEALANGDLAILGDARVIQAYADQGQYKKIVEIGKMKVAAEPNNGQYHVSLAAAYLKIGDRQSAIAEIRKAIEIVPDFSVKGEYFIKEIQAGRDPSNQ